MYFLSKNKNIKLQKSIFVFCLVLICKYANAAVTTPTTVQKVDESNINSPSINETFNSFFIVFKKTDDYSADFLIQDDNETALNYYIDYYLTSKPYDAYQEDELLQRTNSIKIQTNLNSIIKQKNSLLSDDHLKTTDDDDNNNNNNNEDYIGEEGIEISTIPSTLNENNHQFKIGDLEPAHYYIITFTVRPKRMYLIENGKRIQLLNNSQSSSPPKHHKIPFTKQKAQRNFTFEFRTLFNEEKAAFAECTGNTTVNTDDIPKIYSNCYVPNSNCTKCRSTCYQKTLPYVPTSVTTTVKDTSSKIVFCEACPCDTTRSTGECVAIQKESSQQVYQDLKCTQCQEPYTGIRCNDCKNEGIDYYKNDRGECIECDCNNNSEMENNKNSTKRKCEAKTGFCIGCLFNTTGRNCDECKDGFSGDAIKRQCIANKIIKNSTLEGITFENLFKYIKNNFINIKFFRFITKNDD
jgi:hypothetical protein